MRLRGLYAVSPDVPDALARLERALAGGVALLQYRSKRRDAAEAREALRLARRHAVPLIVNDDVELALEIGADGAHLGRDDGDLATARRRLGNKILGASCYDRIELARDAVAAGADYVAFGAFYPTATKDPKTRADPEILEIWSEIAETPCVAIGGITVDNAELLVRAGADFLAVSAGVWAHPQGPRAAVAAFNAIFEAA